MNLQHDRITALCERLNLQFGAQAAGVLAQQAARDEMPYSDFLESLLKEEAAGRNARKQTTMTRLAGFQRKQEVPGRQCMLRAAILVVANRQIYLTSNNLWNLRNRTLI